MSVKKFQLKFCFALLAIVALACICGFGPAPKAPPSTQPGDSIASVVGDPAASRCDTLEVHASVDIPTTNTFGVRISAVESIATYNPVAFHRSLNGNGIYFPVPGGTEQIATGPNTTFIRFYNPNPFTIMICTERTAQ
ncbi:MAG: hypothetical protein VB050_18270 [Geobacteraceae bacterium]|nr:hypothetical protein [Geobacteraceae bacterium]